MDECPDGKPECSERDGQCYVQRCRTRRVPESKTFVADMSRVRNGADHPGRQSPHLYMTGRQGKHDANESVYDAEDDHRTKPRLPN